MALKRVMLDANVILTGALSPGSPASALRELGKSVAFIVSNYVLDECRNEIQKSASGALIAKLGENTV